MRYKPRQVKALVVGWGAIFHEGSGADSAEGCKNLSFFFFLPGMWMGWLELQLVSYDHEVSLRLKAMC